MSRLTGKVAVVTGGNSGIGMATARLFRAEGAKVAISGRDQKTLDEAVRAIGGNVIGIRSDVSKLADIEKLFTVVVEKWGKLDILFANAGIAKFAPVSDVTEAHFDEIFDINVRGLFFSVQKALPHLNDGAAIVLNASVVDDAGLPGASVYSASKAAVRSFARTLTAELADRGIRINVVSPGPVPTGILRRNGMSPEAIDETLRGLVSQVPLKRPGKPEEVASAVLFLAAPESSYVAGVDLKVDGGMGQV
ncbi:MAG: oxidoreductase [Acidobacteria bacterium]|nr:MAG: oxidoreductase [Acidobacteriota bacterium]PYY09797.1 MAG: oxidoreductase [Acidobacteriota bacterium]